MRTREGRVVRWTRPATSTSLVRGSGDPTATPSSVGEEGG